MAKSFTVINNFLEKIRDQNQNKFVSTASQELRDNHRTNTKPNHLNTKPRFPDIFSKITKSGLSKLKISQSFKIKKVKQLKYEAVKDQLSQS